MSVAYGAKGLPLRQNGYGHTSLSRVSASDGRDVVALCQVMLYNLCGCSVTHCKKLQAACCWPQRSQFSTGHKLRPVPCERQQVQEWLDNRTKHKRQKGRCMPLRTPLPFYRRL
eukprot:5024444-Amphidinium_carterae.1